MKEELLKLFEKVKEFNGADAAILLTDNNKYQGISMHNYIYRDRIDAVMSVISQALTCGDKSFQTLYYYSKDLNNFNKDIILEHFTDEEIYLFNEESLYIITKKDVEYEKWLS